MKLEYTQILPTIQIAIQILSAFPYLYSGDIKHFVYWIAAAVLNITVTF